jgi:hypothetical protein
VKFAFLSESEVDGAALAAFCAARLGREIERVPCPARVRPGWPSLRTDLPPALLSLKWTEAELIVVCADSDGMEPGQPDDRLAQLQRIVDRAGMSPRVVIAVAVPAIEAWWLAPKHPELHEKGWFARRTQRVTYDKLVLKRRLYGTDKPLGIDMRRIMPNAAGQAAAHHEQLATRFPLGLGPLLKKLAAIEAGERSDR